MWERQALGGGGTIEESRIENEALYDAFPLPDDVSVESTDVGSVPAVRVETPPSDPGPAAGSIVYLHGGGYALGSAWLHREFASRIGRAAGMPVLSLDYSLAPESRFPAPVLDVLRAYVALIDSEGEYRLSPGEIVLVGESAGAGLALGSLVAMRDAGLALPAGAALLSPWVDLDCEREASETTAPDPILKMDTLALLAQWYLGEADPRSPWASPLHAELGGLPPLLVQAGTGEIFFADAEALAERAGARGVEAELQIVADVPHVWHLFSSFLPEGERSIEEIGRFARARVELDVPDLGRP
jgi:monoterpene epsilon-lactone hydrolase